jgi:hypothetical protein
MDRFALKDRKREADAADVPLVAIANAEDMKPEVTVQGSSFYAPSGALSRAFAAAAIAGSIWYAGHVVAKALDNVASRIDHQTEVQKVSAGVLKASAPKCAP